MKQFFNSVGITEHDQILYDMGMKEKEHEVYFLDKIKMILGFHFSKNYFHGGKTKASTILIWIRSIL
jgi:hypothetical protein